MRGVVLDPRTGAPVGSEILADGEPYRYRNYLADAHASGRLPDSVMEYLEKARAKPRGSGPNATKQGFFEILAADIADGTQILNSAAEAVITPDYTFAANDPHIYPSAYFKIECQFDVSNVVTTPGTLTFRIRWGGVGGTVLAATAAIALSATARANFTGSLEAVICWRSIGSAGSAFCMGKVFLNDVPVAADSAPQGIYTMTSGGANIPAVVSALATNTATALSVTAQFSVATATTQLTNHLRTLASLN